jgi:dTDP-L-rhamnose 4-epimerase
MNILGSTVLVTGGLGLIGSHVVDLLLQRGCRVKILDNLEPEVHPDGKPPWTPQNAELVIGDVQNPSHMERALEGVDVVFHLAAFTGFSPDARKDFEANAIGTACLYETIAHRSFPIQKIVVASSQAVYGEGAYRCLTHGTQYPETRDIRQLRQGQWDPLCPFCQEPLIPIPTSEESPKHGSTAYAISKYAGERLAMSYGRKSGISTVALRYAVAYGPRQSVHNAYVGPISIFSIRLLNERPPICFEDGTQLRDWIYVEDIARATLFVMEEDRTDFQVYNIGTGQTTSVRSIAERLAQILNKDISPSISGRFRPGDTRHLIYDVSRLQALGFRSQVSLDEGLRRYVDWLLRLSAVPDAYASLETRMTALGAIQPSEVP